MNKATSKSIDRLKLKLPIGSSLPEDFEYFATAKLPLRTCWTALDSYGIKKSAEVEMVPFAHLADGALVAFWFTISPPAIVVFDAHGDPPRIVAKDFLNFLRAISKSQTGHPDLDEECPNIFSSRYGEKPMRSGIAVLQKKLDKWSKENSTLLEPKKDKQSEALRKRLHKVAKKMILDGLSKVYKMRDYWSMDYQIKRTRASLQVQYLDYGAWYEVPVQYDFISIVTELLTLVKDPKLRKYELTVTKDGLVSVNDDKQLVIVQKQQKLT